MISHVAAALAQMFGRMTVSETPSLPVVGGTILAANHTSLADPVLVVAALRRLGIDPVIMATAGLWRVPVLGGALAREGHIPVHRGTARAASSLADAAEALAAGRCVLMYGEGRIPDRRDSGEAAPLPFRSGLARLALATGAPVRPVGQAGARRVSSGTTAKQLAGVLTAPVRRPRVHVHVGAPLFLPEGLAEATAVAHGAVTSAWHTAQSGLATIGRPSADRAQGRQVVGG
ncbi:lysophospholipid acyltransferase family protein [Streptomyces sp. H27-H1]|uniref:lysophospholipid acyltransferase family protein n=1 Tax=Streptomyces sp. H27-H1 TaxID=2996461 RepID=UPI00227017E6|nr:lysophospholipid acyltransferase family protein [Streptomyces sp. H27-H1]MCY0926802.1 lysophospholipid acyltransferase family protein [Streptomyces sp. H27-H1]